MLKNSLGNILIMKMINDRSSMKERKTIDQNTLIDCVVPCVSILMNRISFEQMFGEKTQVLKLFYSEMVLLVFQRQVMKSLEQDSFDHSMLMATEEADSSYWYWYWYWYYLVNLLMMLMIHLKNLNSMMNLEKD